MKYRILAFILSLFDDWVLEHQYPHFCHHLALMRANDREGLDTCEFCLYGATSQAAGTQLA